MANRKTKKRNKEFLRILRMIELVLVAVSFVWVFFFVILATTGGWDDIHLRYVAGAPIFALLALGVSAYRIYKHDIDNHVAIPPLAALGVSALFFCYVAIIEVLAYTAMI